MTAASPWHGVGVGSGPAALDPSFLTLLLGKTLAPEFQVMSTC